MDLTRAKIAVFLGRHRGAHSGLWVYGCGLVGALAKDTAKISGLRLVFAGPEELRLELLNAIGGTGLPGLELKQFPSTSLGRRLGSLLDLFSVSLCGSDLAHGTANTLPFWGGKKRVLSLHDLLQAYPSENPSGLYRMLRSFAYRLKFFLLLRTLDLVLVDHQSTRDELRRRFGSQVRVEVVYPGLSAEFLTASLPSSASQSKEFLAFASPDPRKNIDGVLAAFHEFLKTDHPGFLLNVVVNDRKTHQALIEKVERLGLSPSCKLHLNLPKLELVKLYARCRACLFPSLAEGFGYPIYESLSQGVPVLCDVAMVIPELASELELALVNCNPRDKLSIYSGLKQVIEIEQSEHWRERVARTVREKLSVERCAEAVLGLYREII